MSIEIAPRFRTLALFQKRIEGDDALMGLAQRRFSAASLGAEIYAESRGEVEYLLNFKPTDEPAALHLARGMDLFDGHNQRQILGFARDFGQHLFGMVVHDQPEVAARFEDYLSALAELDRELGLSPGSPMVFIEYAVGLDPEAFTAIFRRCQDLDNVSACIDIGHVAMRQARLFYARRDPHRDVFSFGPEDPLLPQCIDGIQASVSEALEAVLEVVRELTAIGKPLHYHLHDGHPLSKGSPFGVSDHLSFLAALRLPFEYEGSRDLPLTFGPAGLSRVVEESLKNRSPLSYTLEIHPTGEREPLGEASGLFSHWTDTANAEKMNHWLGVVTENHRLLRGILTNLTAPDERTG